MARLIKQQEHAERRNEILDVAQKLVYTKGYEQMSIQDILEALHISKGAFYHYFDSKQALLEALTERMMDEIASVLDHVVRDPTLPALTKLQRYFDTAARWKSARKPMMLELMRIWYDDHNALVRQKVLRAAVKRVAPLLGQIIRQGVQEGVLTTRYPDEAGEIVLATFQSLGDAFIAPLLLQDSAGADDLKRAEQAIAAYTEALERILGAPAGSLKLIEPGALNEWASASHASNKPPKSKRSRQA
ncbi:MAG: TetR/AcrR family transcriptional regulator [Anaerolineae bacterium]|nr:TetR/AcrR family transcriptional regulator [Thermoflexales bacterium]MDW8407962.1 TetR/AcrR family transcriptional regulator [Anaerolineae bacterium]